MSSSVSVVAQSSCCVFKVSHARVPSVPIRSLNEIMRRLPIQQTALVKEIGHRASTDCDLTGSMSASTWKPKSAYVSPCVRVPSY